MRGSSRVVAVALLGAMGCGGVPLSPGAGAGADSGGADAGPGEVALDAGANLEGGLDGGLDAGEREVARCPTQGPGGIVAPASCVAFSPAQAGADSRGYNANRLQYALGPAGTPRGVLVVALAGSNAGPGVFIASPRVNLLNTLASAGFHVISLGYRSSTPIASLCAGQPDCFGATRRTLILGAVAPGSAPELSDLLPDEGVLQRLDGALRLLEVSDPAGAWSQFRPRPTAAALGDRFDWPKIIATGHSQGGGHAAYLGKLFALKRVVQLSATCDATGATPAPWTQASSGWVTAPSEAFVGFGAPTRFTGQTPTGGDTLCPFHASIWNAMGLSPARQFDDAEVCGNTGNTHNAAILCLDNAPRWAALFQ